MNFFWQFLIVKWQFSGGSGWHSQGCLNRRIKGEWLSILSLVIQRPTALVVFLSSALRNFWRHPWTYSHSLHMIFFTHLKLKIHCIPLNKHTNCESHPCSSIIFYMQLSFEKTMKMHVPNRCMNSIECVMRLITTLAFDKKTRTSWVYV